MEIPQAALTYFECGRLLTLANLKDEARTGKDGRAPAVELSGLRL
jgi:hypothetical protein